ncbi:MAG: PKD domain-containing protein, partial [Bacteroidetes bacterium]|nr:PKD domain-containing protein [Bacteroidota bacterium]
MENKKQKTSFIKLTTVLIIVTLASIGIKATAQCSPSFTYTVNPANGSEVFYTQTATGTGINTKYSWDFGDSNYDTMQSPKHTYNHSGFFNVCLTIRDSILNCNQTYCDSISVNNGTCHTSFSISEDTANTFNFISSTSFGIPPYTYQWDFGDNSFGSTQANPTHQYADTGFYYICLMVRDINNVQCDHCEYKLVAGDSDSCITYYDVSRDSSNLSLLYFYPHISWGRPPYNYKWNFGDGKTSTAMYPIHQYADTGYFQVCLTVVDSNGVTCGYCAAPHSGVLTKGCGSFNYSIDPGNLGLFNFHPVPAFGSPPYTYYWTFGDGGTSTQSNPVHQYSREGYFNVCVIISDVGGIQCNICNYAAVDSSQKCDAIFQVVQDSTNLNSFYIFVNHTSHNNTYLWNFGDGGTSTLANPIHNYVGTGPYQLCLNVTGDSSCTDFYCDSVYAGRSSTGLSLTVIVPSITKIDEHE